MRFSASVLTALAVVPLAVFAQDPIKVLVGDDGLTFSPPNITAQQGQKVAFEFRSKNHTVTQSTFADPCIPGTFNNSAGADSGFMFIDPKGDFSQGFPTWTITVNTDQPLWFHCSQNTPVNHCQSGMVFSINETPEKSFQAYQDKAKTFDPSTLPPPGSQPDAGQSNSSAPSSTDASSAAGPDGASAPPSGAPSTAAPPPSVTPPPPPGGAVPPPAGSTSSAAQDQTNSTGTGAAKTNGAGRTGVSVRGLSGVVGAIVLGAVLI